MAIISLEYGVWFGTGDGSDMIDYYFEVDEEDYKKYRRAVRLHQNFEDGRSDVEYLLEKAKEEIRVAEMDSFLEMDDDFVRECTGLYPVDPDDINDLVADRDPHTLEFFGLDGMDDEELDEWDAYDQDELPDVCDFDEDFVEEDPFDSWSLIVHFAEHPEEKDVTPEEAEENVRELLAEANGDYTELREYLSFLRDPHNVTKDYDGYTPWDEKLQNVNRLLEENGLPDRIICPIL